MRRPTMLASVFLTAALGLGALGAGAVLGPPLICHSIAIGESKSLPWGSGSMEGKKGYDRKGLVKDTFALLKGEQNMIVRMETLRRAAIYAHDDPGVAWELIGQLAMRALEDRTPSDEAIALFDTGFVVAVLNQMNGDLVRGFGRADGVPGYAYVKRAIGAAKEATYDQVAAMEYGAAIMTLPEMRHAKRAAGGAGAGDDIYDAHIRAAALGAEPGSLLENNLAAHLSNWGTSLEKAKAAAKTHGATNVSARQ